MDHLPRVHGATVPQIEICLVDGNSYDNLGFVNYPKRQGYQNDLEILGLREESAEMFMSLLQTWLYFGLLTDFLQEPIPVAAFSREDDATRRRLLCSSALPEYCVNWKQRILALPFATQIGQLEKAQLCLSKATLLSDRWDDHHKSEEDLALTFVVSVKILIESLTTAVHWVQKYHSSTFPSFLISVSLLPRSAVLLWLYIHQLQHVRCGYQCYGLAGVPLGSNAYASWPTHQPSTT